MYQKIFMYLDLLIPAAFLCILMQIDCQEIDAKSYRADQPSTVSITSEKYFKVLASSQQSEITKTAGQLWQRMAEDGSLRSQRAAA